MKNPDISKLFNLDELNKEWEEGFYENEWEVDTVDMTELEEKICMELTSFLPRHMLRYDWNLPYAEKIILIVRRALANSSVAHPQTRDPD